MNSSEDVKSLFNKWKQDRTKLEVIFTGVTARFSFTGFVVHFSDKGFSLSERAEPSTSSPGAIMVVFRLKDILSFESATLDRRTLPPELEIVSNLIVKSWSFLFKTGEKLVIHQKPVAS